MLLGWYLTDRCIFIVPGSTYLMCNECKFIWQHQTSRDSNPFLPSTITVSGVAQVLAPDLVGAPANPQQSQGKNMPVKLVA